VVGYQGFFEQQFGFKKQFFLERVGLPESTDQRSVCPGDVCKNLDEITAKHYSEYSTFDTTPRLWFRSQSPRRDSYAEISMITRRCLMSNPFKEGLRDSVVFGIGFVFAFLAIGILGNAESFSLIQVLSSTVFIFSTPLQFLLIQSIHSGWVLIPIILAMNARFLLMSGALASAFKEIKLRHIMSSLILIVPSVFTGCMLRFKNNRAHAFQYFLGLGTPIYVISILCTVIGFIAGVALKSPVLYGMMEVVLPLQFTALAAKHWPDYCFVVSYWSGFVLAPFAVCVFHEYTLLITPLFIGMAMVWIENKIMLVKSKKETCAS
jgi:predicted branched-subunit amino acid permease